VDCDVCYRTGSVVKQSRYGNRNNFLTDNGTARHTHLTRDTSIEVRALRITTFFGYCQHPLTQGAVPYLLPSSSNVPHAARAVGAGADESVGAIRDELLHPVGAADLQPGDGVQHRVRLVRPGPRAQQLRRRLSGRKLVGGAARARRVGGTRLREIPPGHTGLRPLVHRVASAGLSRRVATLLHGTWNMDMEHGHGYGHGHGLQARGPTA
jgi:hypothetical protein